MNRRSGSPIAASILLPALLAGMAFRPAFAEDPAALIRDAAYNEAHAHAKADEWAYRVEKRVDGHILTEQQIDTTTGPVYRVLAIDGVPLNAAQQQKEQSREDQFLHDPGLQATARKQFESDDRQLQKLLQLLPNAFLFQEKSQSGDEEVLTFRPNPHFHPDGYAQRVMQALQGVIVINLRDRRIAHMNGTIFQKVEFGFGILGRINPGGTFEIGRESISPGQWKTTLLRIDITGRFSFFATVGKQEYEQRSDFHRVPGNLSVADAFRMLHRLP
jgi:hypothetical protein